MATAEVGESCQDGNVAAISHKLSGVASFVFIGGREMKHSAKIKVYYADTDSYGVVWHGGYFRWLEQGRVEYLSLVDLSTEQLEKDGYTFPVVDLNCKYKSPAKNFEELLMETTIEKMSKFSITFSQKIKRISDNSPVIEASVTVVAIDKNGKLYRRLPEFIYKPLFESIESKEPDLQVSI